MKIFAAPAEVITAPKPTSVYYYWRGVPDLRLIRYEDVALRIGTLSVDGQSIVPVGHFGNGWVRCWNDVGWTRQLIEGDYYHPEIPSRWANPFIIGCPGFEPGGLIHFEMVLHTFAVQMHAGITEDLWLEAEGIKPADTNVVAKPIQQFQIGTLP
jgi:hypothetical protein